MLGIKTTENINDCLINKGKMFLNAPAEEEQIASFEKQNDVLLPEQYKEWLLKSDGGDLFLPAGVQFFGVAHKPFINVDNDDRPSKEYVVIGSLASGDPILFKKGEQHVLIYNHEAGRIESDEVYDDFISFLNDLPEIIGLDE